MKVKRSLLILCLATGLSLGGLYGCGGGQKASDSNNSATTTSGETATDTNAGANDAEIENIKAQLEAVKTAHQELKTFIDSIVITKDGNKDTVANPVDYTKAQQLVNGLAIAYDNLKNSLSDDIKSKINFNTISPHLGTINNIVKADSPERAILNYLATGYPKDTPRDGTKAITEYGEAQTALSQLQIDGQPIYSGGVDSKDGSGQRIAVKNFLSSKIYQPIEPLTKVTITVKSSEGENGGGGNSGGENGGESGVENNSNKSTSDNGWILSLVNTFALLGAAGTGAFVIYKLNQLNAATNKEDNPFVVKLEPEEDQQTNEQVRAKQELDTNLKKIQDSLQEIKDSFIDDSISEGNEQSDQKKSFRFPIKFGKQEKENTLIGLDNKQYNELIRLIKKLGVLLDDTYTAMLKYKSFSRYDQALKLSIEHIQKSIDEHLEGLENPPSDQDKPKQAINGSLSTIQPKIDSILQNIKLLLPSNSQNSTPTVDNTLTAQEIQKFNDRIQVLTEERDYYKREIQEKDHQITQLKTGETGKIQQEYQELFHKHQELNDNYTKIYPYYENYQTIEKERDDINTELNEVRQQLQEKIEQKEEEIKQKDQQINELTREVERLTAVARREAPQDNQLSSQWQALVNAYQLNPENIKNNAMDEVMEDDDKLQERRKNSGKPVIFSSNKSAEGYYIISSGNDYLLFPKQHGIPASQKYTATAVFEGYKQGSTSKFTSIVPAQVTSLGNGMWQLKNKGRLEYS